MDSCGGMQTGHSASRLPRPCCSLLLSESSLLQGSGFTHIIAVLQLRNQENAADKSARACTVPDGMETASSA